MRIRTLTISLVGCAAVSVAAPAIASASTVHDFLPPAVANAIPQFVADAVQPLLPPAPVMRAGTIQDFLPREIVGLIPTMLADPFVPQHLADMIEHLGDFLNGVDEEFASHFGGVLHFPTAPSQATVGDPPPTPAETPAEAPDPRRDELPDNKTERPRPVEEPIQPSLFDDLDDQ